MLELFPVACSIVVTPQSGAIISDLTTSGNQIIIANVNENCNSNNGYTLSLTSSNTGSYTGKLYDPLSGDGVNYIIYYDNSPISSTIITNAHTADNTFKNLSISYSGKNSLTPSNSYSDTLNFTITAK